MSKLDDMLMQLYKKAYVQGLDGTKNDLLVQAAKTDILNWLDNEVIGEDVEPSRVDIETAMIDNHVNKVKNWQRKRARL
jgi:hypothetical protein